MNSTELLKNRLVHGTASFVIAAMMGTIAPSAMAQDSASDDEEFEEEVEEVVITGSRIRRSEFTSASPIQVLSGDKSRELGLFDAGDILKNTTQSSGTQIDNTFGGFVLDNGPGSNTIGLRGLDPERTLVLLNGRRIAPSGIGGAPTSADLNLIPGVMIDRVEVLLDGASTIYGSDAIAGVANVMLKKDIEGFQTEVAYSLPESGGGEELVASAMWGTTSDAGFFTVGAEFYDRKAMSLGQNTFLDECEGFYYEDENGNILTGDQTVDPEPSDFTNCNIFPLTNRVSIPVFWGSVYYTPGQSNTGPDANTVGIPNFSESSVPFDFVNPDFGDPLFPHWAAFDSDADGVLDSGFVDANGDGFKDFDFMDPFYAWERSDYANSGDFISELRRISIVANGEYNLQDDNDTTLFFDGFFAQRESDIFAPGTQLFEVVPADNPYNICNPDGLNGVDCLGVLGFPIGATSVTPIVTIRGDREYTDNKVWQYRAVGGIRGNVGAMDNFGEGNWAYEAYLSHSYSKGTQDMLGISEARLLQALDASVDGNGNVVCNDTSNGCVPVNLFGDNIFQEGGGRFTDAEEAFLMVNRHTETIVKQTIASGIINGDLFRLPWNDGIVPIVFGYEFRRDTIESRNNDVATEGLLWGWFSDGGADGSRDLHEFFAETELPLLRGKPFAEELTFSASARWTDESFYSPASTYSLKGVYRPNEWLTFRGSYGTSYRAPNLRERFLNGTTGFRTVSDPCVVPDAARDGNPLDPTAPSTYNAANDNRQQHVLDACSALGVDPTSLGLDPNLFGSYSVETNTGGSEDLTEERSKAYTYGVVFEQPWSDAFDLRFAATYFDIDIEGSIEDLSAPIIVDECYDNLDQPNGTSGFCSRITRGSDGSIDLVDASFINVGQITSKGWDLNMVYEQDFEVGSKTLGVTLDLRATYTKENIFDILGDVDDAAGETEAPHWRSTANLTLSYDDFRLNWQTRWIQGGEEDDPDDFDPNGIPCDNLPGVSCRPVYYTKNYNTHDASVYWSNGKYSITAGVQNVFNTGPSKVDADGVFSVRNFPIGAGYDVFGRTFFMSVGAKF
ncbi:MAG: TonB-dependent receptor [Alphaproteobacteria bacterium]|nr:TonB-dependent receptor [Alphaproteobacteria bacterium]